MIKRFHMRYTHFSKTERLEISVLLKRGLSHREIGLALGKHHSSVSREININSVNGEYNPHKAEHKAYVKRKYSKYQGMKVNENQWLERHIREGLQQYWTPEEIAGRLSYEYGRSLISFKSIYKWLYSVYGQSLCVYLPSKQYHPGKRKGKKQTKVLIPNRISIEERPEIINMRVRCGDFEGDTLGVPKERLETLAGIADRKSRYFLAKKIARIRYAVDGFKELSSSLIHLYSFTFDNGVENVRHQELGVSTYFCHAYASWEKGTIENSFKRLRRFIPKKSLLNDYSDKDIATICDIMNNTPRKCLGWKKPKEVFEEQSRITYQLTMSKCRTSG